MTFDSWERVARALADAIRPYETSKMRQHILGEIHQYGGETTSDASGYFIASAASTW